MTINFNRLKSNHYQLSDDKIIEILMKYDYSFFSGWIVFNKLMYPQKTIAEYTIDLPVKMIDDINKMLAGG